MKTNLLKITFGLFLLALTASNVKAQIYASEFFEYPDGALVPKNGGNGWAGPWFWRDNSGTSSLENHNVKTGTLPGNTRGKTLTVLRGPDFRVGDLPARAFAQQPNINGKIYWFSFYFKQSSAGSQFAGFSLLDFRQETVYLGKQDFDQMGFCCAWPDATFNPDDRANMSGETIVTDSHFYLGKITMLGGEAMKVDYWADYAGATEPTLTDPTFQVTGFFKEAPGGVNSIRLASAAGLATPPEITSFGSFNAVQFSDVYANVKKEGALPLTNVKLKATSVANGNLISWTSESQVNVASLAVERKDASGDWVNISGSLSVKATSFTDTNPLAGDNYYKLVSTDNNGGVEKFGPEFVAGLESDASIFYPNPVTGGELNVVAGKQAINSVSLFDLSGKRVSFKANSGSASKITLNTTSLNKGVYILEVNGQKSTSRNKVVIN